MDMQPFTTDDCTMCGSTGARFKYCEGTCLKTTHGYDDVTCLGDRGQPHLHRLCFQCGFVWLTVVKGKAA